MSADTDAMYVNVHPGGEGQWHVVSLRVVAERIAREIVDERTTDLVDLCRTQGATIDRLADELHAVRQGIEQLESCVDGLGVDMYGHRVLPAPQ